MCTFTIRHKRIKLNESTRRTLPTYEMLEMLVLPTCFVMLLLSLFITIPPSWGQPSDQKKQTPSSFNPDDYNDQGTASRCFNPSKKEKEAKVSFYNKKLNRARTQVESVLEHQKQPILGAYILGLLYEEAEGNFAKALYWVSQSEKWLLERCSSLNEDIHAKKFHQDLITQQAFLLGDLDRRQEQLDTLERYDSLYQPPRHDYKMWPLVKLGRFEEARQYGLELIKSDLSYVRSRAYNGLMAVECEARNRESSYEWGLKGHIDAQKESCVIALNLALASRQTFRFKKEEQYNRVALNARDQDCSISPYIQIAETYLIQGEFQKSISALTKWAPASAQEWMRSHMQIKQRRAELLYSLGIWNKGLKEIYDVVTYPDRAAGTDSSSEEMLHLEASLIYWALLDGQRITLQEKLASRGWGAWIKSWGEWSTLLFTQWTVERQIIRFAAHQNHLIDLIRPYFSKLLPWYTPLIGHIIGKGVIDNALQEATALEQMDFPKQAHAYLDTFRAELSWLNHDDSAVLEYVESALKGIPKLAQLVRYRMITLRWAANRRLGKVLDLDDDLHLLLRSFPVVLRTLDLKLPVQIKGSLSSQSKYAPRFIKAIRSSPRFEVNPRSKLKITFTQTPTQLKACLTNNTGYRYSCVSEWIDYKIAQEKREQKRRIKKRQDQKQQAQDIEDPSQSKDQEELDKDPLNRLVDRLHFIFFSPKVELSQAELDTLDGNTHQLNADDAAEVLFE